MGGGIGMGNTCKSMADSFQCMTKPTTIKKKKKNLPANAGDSGDTGDMGSISGLGRCSGGEHGNPLQYSCLKRPVDRGAWWATVPGVAKSDRATEHTQCSSVLGIPCFSSSVLFSCTLHAGCMALSSKGILFSAVFPRLCCL